MLELAAESGCTMLSIGFESISRATLKSVHKHVNRPETFAALVEKVHSYGIIVFGLFMFGFDGDDPSVFEETARFNRERPARRSGRSDASLVRAGSRCWRRSRKSRSWRPRRKDGGSELYQIPLIRTHGPTVAVRWT
jgi:hypothetical protein